MNERDIRGTGNNSKGVEVEAVGEGEGVAEAAAEGEGEGGEEEEVLGEGYRPSHASLEFPLTFLPKNKNLFFG